MNDEPSPSASSLPATDIEAVPQPIPPLDHSSSQDSIAFSSTPPPPPPSSSLILSQPKKTTTLKLRIGSKSQSQSQEPSQQQQQQQTETATPSKRPITISFTAPQLPQHAPQQIPVPPKKPTVDYTFPYTWEDQFIIRFPPSLVPTIAEALGTDGKGSLDDILKISFFHRKNESPIKHPTHSGLFKSPRRAKVTIKVMNNDESNENNTNTKNNSKNNVKQRDAILLDLPGIVESHKTVDKSQYTKVADIHQILLVFDENIDADERYAFYEREDFRFSSGLTPPMRDVRPRRWDKTGGMSVPPPNVLKRQEEIEQKVQGILDADCRAEGSCFRLFDSRTGKIVLEGGNEDFLDHDDGLIGRSGSGGGGDIDDTQSDLKQPTDDEFAMELEDDIGGGNGNGGGANGSVITGTQDDNLSEISSITAGTEASKQPLQTAHQALEVQNNLLLKIEERKKQLCSITNPIIRARLEDVIGQLEMDLQRNNQQQQQQ